LGEIEHELARGKGTGILEGHVMWDHLHMCVSTPAKCSVSITRELRGKQRSSTGEQFWTRGYFVSAVGLDEGMVRE